MQPIANTAQLLIEKSTQNLFFESARLLLTISSLLDEEAKTYLSQLAHDAQRIAVSHACSSVLVGEGNESDDTGDVAIWLGQGDFGPGKHANVLKALGLEEWTGDAVVAENQDPALIKELKDSGMQDRYCFRINCDSTVIVFLLGRLEHGWGGLAGAVTERDSFSAVMDPLPNQIQKLQDLQKQLQQMRAVPLGLLQTPLARKAGSVTEGLKAVKEIGEVGLSNEVQGALHRAKQSLAMDATDLGESGRREKRKRRLASPEGYVGEDRLGRTAISYFPPLAEEGVKMEGLGDWAREYNRTNSNKLRIRDRVLRLAIPDVMTVYMTFGVGDGTRVQVETIRVFGPRETRGPHGQSGYGVFQQLSQQLGKVLEEEGQVKLQSIVGLVGGYSELFISRCRVCGRVVSGDGHVPAVVRRWDTVAEAWIGEHVGCVTGAANA